MNETFNFKRFFKCLRADLTRGASRFGVTLICIGLFPVYIGLLDAIDLVVQKVRGFEYGMPETNRAWFILILVALILALTLPKSLYGHVTDKRAGADFILTPASSLEKYLSMAVVCLIVAPAVFFGLYFGSEALVNLIDPRYGTTALRVFTDTGKVAEAFGQYEILLSFFLLGAIWFRRRKIVYTVLCGVAYAFVVATAFLIVFMSVDPGSNDLTGNAYSLVGSSGISLADTLHAVILEIVLLALIYLRIRKIKV